MADTITQPKSQPARRIETGIDWSLKPEPWRWIGPTLRREVDAICSGVSTATSKPQPLKIDRTLMTAIRQSGMTQFEVAARAGVSPGFITNLIYQRTSASPATWQRIWAALKTEPAP